MGKHRHPRGLVDPVDASMVEAPTLYIKFFHIRCAGVAEEQVDMIRNVKTLGLVVIG